MRLGSLSPTRLVTQITGKFGKKTDEAAEDKRLHSGKCQEINTHVTRCQRLRGRRVKRNGMSGGTTDRKSTPVKRGERRADATTISCNEEKDG